MAGAWGKSAWADDVEEQEESGTLAAPVAAPFGKEEAFPSLATAVKEAPKKKPKGKSMPLGAFLSGSAAAASRGAMDDASILLNLPKSSSGQPREEREGGGLGGAFRDYGGDRAGFGRRGGGGGGFGDRDREDGDGPRRDEPSRADEADDWGANRKFQPSESGGSRGFGGGFRDRGGDRGGDREGGFGDRPRREAAPSAADEADNWGANRKFQPAADGERRGGGGGGGGFGGGGFRERDGPSDRRPRGDEPSRADTEDWGTRRAPPPAEDRAGPSGRRPGFGFSGSSTADAEDRWARSGPPAGAAAGSDGAEAPRERPRLNLKPRSKGPEGSSAPASPSQADGAADALKKEKEHEDAHASKPNPFGAARPREEVLKEKGRDYRKEELKLEHGEVIRDKTPEEEALEAEVEALRKQLEGMKELQAGEEDTLKELEEEFDSKEKALYKLQAELDDQVKFGKKRPEERRVPPPEAADDRNFERAGPRRGGGAGEQQPERGGERGERGGGGGFRDREERGPRDREGSFGGRGGGSFRDRDREGRGPRGPPPGGERRTPAW